MRKPPILSKTRILESDLSEGIRTVWRYWREYSHPLLVLWKVRRGMFPINVVLKRDKRPSILNNKADAYLHSIGFHSFESPGSIMKFRYHSHDVFLKGYEANGDIHSIFVKGEYMELAVNGKIVIDVGANLGDSSIFFALQGAKKVLAIEPIPQSYSLAVENVKLNGLCDVVHVLNASCNDRDTELSIDDTLTAGTYSKVILKDSGKKIPAVTIETLSNLFSKGQLVLKMDCEGCEYRSLLNSKEEVLKKFGAICIEYHDDPDILVRHLMRIGFSVKLSPGRFHFLRSLKKWIFIGKILAIQERNV